MTVSWLFEPFIHCFVKKSLLVYLRRCREKEVFLIFSQILSQNSLEKAGEEEKKEHKAKKEAHAFPKAEAKARGLKAKKAVLEGVHSHRKMCVTYLLRSDDTVVPKAA